jgi:hypothetical protein
MQEFNRAGPMLHLLLRYTQALITQMAQTAVCNRHHSLDQQLCRWLLLSLDRLDSNQLVMTQELIANMLGVRREGVTEAAGDLHAPGSSTINAAVSPCSTAQGSNGVPANAMPWSRRNTIAAACDDGNLRIIRALCNGVSWSARGLLSLLGSRRCELSASNNRPT